MSPISHYSSLTYSKPNNFSTLDTGSSVIYFPFLKSFSHRSHKSGSTNSFGYVQMSPYQVLNKIASLQPWLSNLRHFLFPIYHCIFLQIFYNVIFCHLQQSGWTWRALCWVKYVGQRKTNTVWYHLYVKSKQTEDTEKENRLVVVRGGGE